MTTTPTLRKLIDHFETRASHTTDQTATPDIGIIMGSDSDLPVMRGAHDTLVELGFSEDTGNGTDSTFSFESYVISAHRTPQLMETYARTAIERGLEVIIAGAGGKSADLPNMTASIAYPLPVIGVPIQEKSVDSVIGMPSGAPILAVDAGKSQNAALSAVQILARQHPTLTDRLVERHSELQEDVATVSQRLHDVGTPRFLDEA